ncbi:MAG: hypothetical protein P4L74_03610 [Candidatus Doudnabacteria bacterium]|nr:hypothetical protein [Candidatus Doudnabacteria bacterium]
MKKTLVAIGLSSVMFLLAGQALAAAYASPEEAAAAAQSGNSAVMMQQSAAVAGQQTQSLMTQLGQGSLSPQDQMSLYKMLQATPVTRGNVMYYGAPFGQTNLMSRLTAAPVLGSGTQQAWFSLMSILTTVLVWVVLLLLIAVLWHWLMSHKHS